MQGISHVRLEILNASVVILAEHHNPTILHPSFLTSEGIVPGDWELAEPPVSTPVFALVKYRNGIVFSVEENKFQVTDAQTKDDFRESPVAVLACRYAEKLPHVHYTAAGINFQGFIERSSPEKAVIDRFIKEGSIDLEAACPSALGLNIVYDIAETRLRLSIDPGKVKRPKNVEERSGILANANYHVDLDAKDRLGGIRKATGFFQTRHDAFLQIMHYIFLRHEVKR